MNPMRAWCVKDKDDQVLRLELHKPRQEGLDYGHYMAIEGTFYEAGEARAVAWKCNDIVELKRETAERYQEGMKAIPLFDRPDGAAEILSRIRKFLYDMPAEHADWILNNAMSLRKDIDAYLKGSGHGSS